MAIGFTGSMWITGSLYINGAEFNALSRSYAVTASHNSNAISSASNGLVQTGSTVELGGYMYRNTYVTGTLDGAAEFFLPPGTGFTSGSGTDRLTTVGPFVDSNERIYYVNFFTKYNEVYTAPPNSGGVIVRLLSDGTFDPTFNSGQGFMSGSQRSLPVAQQIKIDPTTSKIYVAGTFTKYSGSDVGKGLIRLNTDGTIDNTFNVGSGFSGIYQANAVNVVYGIDIDSNGKVYAVGNFTSYSGSSVGPCIVRINQDGTIDTSFDNNVGNLLPGYNGTSIFYVKVEPITNKIYISGWISAYKGVTGFSGLVKVNPDGSVDTTFNGSPGLEKMPYVVNYPTGYITYTKIGGIVIDKDLNVYLLGSFVKWNGVSANGIVKITSSGSIDTSFKYGSGFTTTLLSGYNTVGGGVSGYLDKYNRLYAFGGAVNAYSGSIVSGSFRILADGTLDLNFPTASLKTYNTASGTFTSAGGGIAPSSNSDKYVYVATNANYQNGQFYISQSGIVRMNVVDPDLSFKKTSLAYDTDYSQFFTSRSIIDKGYVDNRLTGSLYPTGSLSVTGSTLINSYITLAVKDPLPVSNIQTGSFMSSGSGADNKPYYWNGSTWTAMI